MQDTIFEEQRHTLESTINREISSILVDFLTLEEVFFKFGLLNKNFHQIVQNLKLYPKVWQQKYIQEFQSNEDRLKHRWASPEGQLKFLRFFPDNVFEPNSKESLFEFFKQAVEKQKSMRKVV